MRKKVIRPNGEEIESEVEDLSTPNVKAFYLKHSGGRMREIILVEPVMRVLQLGKDNAPGSPLKQGCARGFPLQAEVSRT